MSISQNTPKSSFRNFFESVGKWFGYKDKDGWVKDMKTGISMTVSIIATMTFSLATNPPGGVVQAGLYDKDQCQTRIIRINDYKNTSKLVCVGEAILATYKHGAYLKFLICNTVCFIASLSIILFLVSGIPINSPFPLWILSTGMCITLTSLALTYLFAANMVTPNTLWNSIDDNAFGIVLIVWVAIVSVVATILIVRLFVRLIYKFLK